MGHAHLPHGISLEPLAGDFRNALEAAVRAAREAAETAAVAVLAHLGVAEVEPTCPPGRGAARVASSLACPWADIGRPTPTERCSIRSTFGVGDGLRAMAPYAVCPFSRRASFADVGIGCGGDARGMQILGLRIGPIPGSAQRLGTGGPIGGQDVAATPAP